MTQNNVFAMLIVAVLIGSASFVGSFYGERQAAHQQVQQSDNLGSFYEDYPTHFGKGLFVGKTKEFALDENGVLHSSSTAHLSTTTVTDFQYGGSRLTISTTSSTYTLTAAQLANYDIISIAAEGAGQAALTLNLPATSTLAAAGITQRKEFIIDSLASAATTTTVTAGTGWDIDGDTANDDVINGGVSGRLLIFPLANGNWRAIVTEEVDAG